MCHREVTLMGFYTCCILEKSLCFILEMSLCFNLKNIFWMVIWWACRMLT